MSYGIENSLQILLIEDDPVFSRTMAATLRLKAPFEFNLHRASTLASGIEMLKAASIDVVLLDLSLPDSHGLDTLKELRAIIPLMPIVIMSGDVSQEMAIEAMKQGAQDYLLKDDLDGRVLSRALLYSIERSRFLQQRDDIMAAIVHDIKSPLLGSERMLDLILKQQLPDALPEGLNKLATLLKQSNRTTLQMLRNLLEIYRYDVSVPQFDYQLLDLGPVLLESINELAPMAATKHLNLRTGLKDGTVKVHADPLAIHRVFTNLISNSITYTPDGGSIDIHLDVPDSIVVVSVQDTGEGISDDDQKFMFERFYRGGTGKRHPIGSGLGLYVCRKIIEAHQGKITCASTTGEGTVISIELPLAT